MVVSKLQGYFQDVTDQKKTIIKFSYFQLFQFISFKKLNAGNRMVAMTS